MEAKLLDVILLQWLIRGSRDAFPLSLVQLLMQCLAKIMPNIRLAPLALWVGAPYGKSWILSFK